MGSNSVVCLHTRVFSVSISMIPFIVSTTHWSEALVLTSFREIWIGPCCGFICEICWCLRICLLTNERQDRTAKSNTSFTSAAYHANALIASNEETLWKTSKQKSTWHIYLNICIQRVYIHSIFMCLLYVLHAAICPSWVVCCISPSISGFIAWWFVVYPWNVFLPDSEKLELYNDLFISIWVGGNCLHWTHSNKPPRNLQDDNWCPTARSINPWRTELEVTVPCDEVGFGTVEWCLLENPCL